MQTPHFIVGMVLLTLVSTANAQNRTEPFAVESSNAVQAAVDAALEKTLQAFPKVKKTDVAVTLVDLRDSQKPVWGHHRGDVQIYPASVVKLFYLAAAHQWMEEGKISDTEELRRAMKDMIVDSGNEPTHYVVDLLTGTTSGPELSSDEMEEWYDKRNAVNRYYQKLGYSNINVNRKPWCEGPYGREMQSINIHKPNHRNWLTTDATARLLSEIALGKGVSAKRSGEMMELLKRDLSSKNSQAREFTGMGLPKGARLWSKAGWTSQTRHDAAYVELPNYARFVLVIFTENHANEKGIIPEFTRAILPFFKK